jgi:hypothetical protein
MSSWYPLIKWLLLDDDGYGVRGALAEVIASRATTR